MRANGVWLLGFLSMLVLPTVCIGEVEPPIAQVEELPPIAQVEEIPPVAQVESLKTYRSIEPLKQSSGVIVGTVTYPNYPQVTYPQTYTYPQSTNYPQTVPGVTVQSRPFPTYQTGYPAGTMGTTQGTIAHPAGRPNTLSQGTGADSIRTLVPAAQRRGVTNCTSLG